MTLECESKGTKVKGLIKVTKQRQFQRRGAAAAVLTIPAAAQPTSCQYEFK